MLLASNLLQLPSKNCKYFGALTFTVVIQNSSLDADKAQEMANIIYSHLSGLISDPSQTGPNLFIIRKLMSNISLLYLKEHLQNPLWQFVRMFRSEDQSFADAVAQLSPAQLDLLLIFLTVLNGDILKQDDYRSLVHASIHEDLYPLIVVLFEYLAYLYNGNQLLSDLDLRSLEALNAWMSYIPNVGGDARYEAGDIAVFVDYIFYHLQQPLNPRDSDAFARTRQCLLTLNELLEINPTLFSVERKAALYAMLLEENNWGETFLNTIVTPDYMDEYQEEINSFVDLVLTVLQLNSIRLSKSLLAPSAQGALSIALRLTAVNGTPFVDEFISERLLVFWEEFANVFQDSAETFVILFESNDDPEFERAFEEAKRKLFDEVAQIYWKKLHIPDIATYNSIRTEFVSYRTSVADFFLVAYSLLKTEFYEMMCESLLQSLQQGGEGSVEDAEATLFLLYKINDDTVYFESQAKALMPASAKIFQHNLIQMVKGLPLDDPTNQLFFSTFVLFLSSNEFFFKTPEGSRYLGEVFETIFPMIMANTSKLSLLASKTATRICEECSDFLVDFLPDLKLIVIEMLKNSSIDSLIRLRMFHAYSSVARSVGNVQDRSSLTKELVSAISDAGSSMMEAAGSSLTDIQEEYFISLLSCLVNMAKGISLDDETVENMLEDERKLNKLFWEKDPDQIKPHVMAIIEKFSLDYQPLSQKPMVVEKCTMVLKSGLGEKIGGPFDFGPYVISNYVARLMAATANPNDVPFIFGLIESMVSANYVDLETDSIQLLIESVFTRRLEFLKTDPDMIKSAINMFTKIIECKPSLIIHSSIFSSTIVRFAVDGLRANELFIVKSIVKFWTSMLNMKRGTREDQEVANRLFLELGLGAAVTQNLFAAFLKAPRLNVDYYFSIFRALIVKHPVAFKSWLIETLAALSDSLTKVKEKEVELFVHKLLVTRGRHTANEVLKQFWLTVNQFVEYNREVY